MSKEGYERLYTKILTTTNSGIDIAGGCVVYSDFHMLFKSMCYFSSYKREGKELDSKQILQ